MPGRLTSTGTGASAKQDSSLVLLEDGAGIDESLNRTQEWLESPEMAGNSESPGSLAGRSIPCSGLHAGTRYTGRSVERNW